MESWEWSSWHHKSYNNADSATHSWTDGDWKSSKPSEEEHRWTDWDACNGQWESWTSNDRWGKEAWQSWQSDSEWKSNGDEQKEWNWRNSEQKWKPRDDWEEVPVEEPKPSASKAGSYPRPTAKKASGAPKTKLTPQPPKTVPPPHVSLGVVRPPPALHNNSPKKGTIKPPLKPVKLLVVPTENRQAPLALRESSADPPTSMSPKRKLASANAELLTKEQKTGHPEQKEDGSGSSAPPAVPYNLAVAQSAASPKSLGGWKPPTPSEESPRSNAEVLAAHAASLALAAGGMFIPGRFLNPQA